jgi:hypothetical protein
MVYNEQLIDHRSIFIKKKTFQLFGVKESWRYDGLYHLQEDDEIVAKASTNEIFKQEINLHPANSRWTKVKQTLVLKGKGSYYVNIFLVSFIIYFLLMIMKNKLFKYQSVTKEITKWVYFKYFENK